MGFTLQCVSFRKQHIWHFHTFQLPHWAAFRLLTGTHSLCGLHPQAPGLSSQYYSHPPPSPGPSPNPVPRARGLQIPRAGPIHRMERRVRPPRRRCCLVAPSSGGAGCRDPEFPTPLGLPLRGSDGQVGTQDMDDQSSAHRPEAELTSAVWVADKHEELPTGRVTEAWIGRFPENAGLQRQVLPESDTSSQTPPPQMRAPTSNSANLLLCGEITTYLPIIPNLWLIFLIKSFKIPPNLNLYLNESKVIRLTKMHLVYPNIIYKWDKWEVSWMKDWILTIVHPPGPNLNCILTVIFFSNKKVSQHIYKTTANS